MPTQACDDQKGHLLSTALVLSVTRGKVMLRNLPKLAVLLLLVAGCSCVQGDSYFRPSKVETHCCKSVSGSRFPYPIMHVRQQAALHPCVKAVIFYTDVMGPICSDPKVRWVKQKLKELRKKPKNVKNTNGKKKRKTHKTTRK
ncbi:eotaxin-like [Lissotriton helveticus]